MNKVGGGGHVPRCPFPPDSTSGSQHIYSQLLLHDSTVLKVGKYQHLCNAREFPGMCLFLEGLMLILYTRQQ